MSAKRPKADLWNVCMDTLNELPRLVDTTALALRARAVVAEAAALRRERDALRALTDEPRIRLSDAERTIERICAERDALRADFERYAQHTEACDWAWAGTQEFKCNCGLDAARARWAKERT